MFSMHGADAMHIDCFHKDRVKLFLQGEQT